MRGEAWGSKEMLCAMCTLISGAASKAIRKRARAAWRRIRAPDQGCCPVTSSGAISDVIRVAARCDQADDLSEGLESARSTARSPKGIETRLHAVCHYGSCDACDGPGVELRGRPRVGLGVAEPCLRTVDSHAGQAGASAWSSLFRGGTPRLIAPSRLVICRAPRRGQPGGGPPGRGACRRARVSFMLSVPVTVIRQRSIHFWAPPQSLHGMVVRLDQTGLCGPGPRPCRARPALHRPPLARAQRSLG